MFNETAFLGQSQSTGFYPAWSPLGFNVGGTTSTPYTGPTYPASSSLGFDVPSGDPTLDPNYVLGGGTPPTYTPPDQWNRNLSVALPGQSDTTTNWIIYGAAGILILAILMGHRR
jgi:hypothetical protein